MQQTLQFDCPTTRHPKNTPKTFMVMSWSPNWNSLERNFGSRCDNQVTAPNRNLAIELAFARRYCGGETIPESQIKLINLDATSKRWRYYIAFFPSGPAVGRGVLLKIQSDKISQKVLWGTIVRQHFPSRPAWIEATRTTR